MNEKIYLKIMIKLGEDLRRAEFAEPYDPDYYNKVLQEMTNTNVLRYRSQRKFSCWTRWIILILGLLFAYVVYSILF